jgi:hypothetical protein
MNFFTNPIEYFEENVENRSKKSDSNYFFLTKKYDLSNLINNYQFLIRPIGAFINALQHSHLYLQAVKLKLATPLSRLQVGLRARPRQSALSS